MSKFRLLAAACLLAAPLAFAADAPAPPTREARVDALFAETDRSDVPGCALGIFQDGRIVYARGYGMANLELGIANTPHTVYDIGSLGKQFTAFSIYLLARDGKLSLDDDVRKYVPELPAFAKPVTIRHLLHHTGGLRDYIELLELEGHGSEDLTTAQEALDTLTRQKAPLFAPGERYEYSNTGYFLLSWVVRRASGKSLRDFAQERIFGPLGMTHTQYNDEHGRIIPNRSQGYSPNDAGGFSIDMSDFEQNGDGGVNTSIEDIFLWNRNFDSPVVGDRHIVEQMEETGVLNSGKKIDYASGQVVGSYRGLRTVGHTGSWAGYRALLYRFPDQKFSVACLCNRANIDRVQKMRQIADIYLADRMTKPAETPAAARTPVAVPAAELDRLAGAYRDAKSGEVWFLSVANGGLVADAAGSRIRFDAADARSVRRPCQRARVAFHAAVARRPTRFHGDRAGRGGPAIRADPDMDAVPRGPRGFRRQLHERGGARDLPFRRRGRRAANPAPGVRGRCLAADSQGLLHARRLDRHVPSGRLAPRHGFPPRRRRHAGNRLPADRRVARRFAWQVRPHGAVTGASDAVYNIDLTPRPDCGERTPGLQPGRRVSEVSKADPGFPGTNNLTRQDSVFPDPESRSGNQD